VVRRGETDLFVGHCGGRGLSRCGEFVRVAGRKGVRDVFEGGR